MLYSGLITRKVVVMEHDGRVTVGDGEEAGRDVGPCGSKGRGGLMAYKTKRPTVLARWKMQLKTVGMGGDKWHTT